MENGYPQTSAPARIDWTRLFFDGTGRIGRGPFLLATAVLLAIFALYEGAVEGAAHALTAWAVHGVLLFAAACVLSKRLHDRSRAGWWAALVLLAFIVVWPQPDGLIDFLFALPLMWAAVELGALPGAAGANRFGGRPTSP
jgi:uncharacterized membrane protein YhaH (DUF805 family)